ncbi:hypothetical protein Enr13x_57970 [Stieleria neptunia]|uniref:Uncharacterized protein n=1 Tax=Stieleria neptunia TaxID=2527979 RepID=A0A518HYN5_9BACT|nr:hypothetical protein [Stieleria neptunia]QDV45894.1 hypothetical protein Enr13x_57970 [Stieleria neptunia]
MAKHEVEFDVPKRPLGRADIEFTVKADGSVLGTLTVSNGSLVWFPKGTTNGCKMGWSKFDALMQEHATKQERR